MALYHARSAEVGEEPLQVSLIHIRIAFSKRPRTRRGGRFWWSVAARNLSSRPLAQRQCALLIGASFGFNSRGAESGGDYPPQHACRPTKAAPGPWPQGVPRIGSVRTLPRKSSTGLITHHCSNGRSPLAGKSQWAAGEGLAGVGIPVGIRRWASDVRRWDTVPDTKRPNA